MSVCNTAKQWKHDIFLVTLSSLFLYLLLDLLSRTLPIIVWRLVTAVVVIMKGNAHELSYGDVITKIYYIIIYYYFYYVMWPLCGGTGGAER